MMLMDEFYSHYMYEQDSSSGRPFHTLSSAEFVDDVNKDPICIVNGFTKNWRLRLKVFAADDDFPCVASVTPVWNSANWFEREAFDMYGVIFDGHDDLRRILTDYGFIGHPMRKDFPVSGHVEMRYDAEQKRVVYQPVTIEPREITPRIIREDKYGGL